MLPDPVVHRAETDSTDTLARVVWKGNPGKQAVEVGAVIRGNQAETERMDIPAGGASRVQGDLGEQEDLLERQGDLVLQGKEAPRVRMAW